MTDTGINLYTKQMIPFFDQSKMGPVPTGFQCLFGAGNGAGRTIYSPDTDEIDIDIRKGTSRSAKLIQRTGLINTLLGPNQVNVLEGNSTSIARSFPLSIEEAPLNKDVTRKRIPGEPQIDSGYTEQMRLSYWAAEAHFDLYKRQVIMFERLASQSILEGKQDAIIGTSNPDLQYDMYRNPDNIRTIGVPWTTHATASPITDMDDSITIAKRNGKRQPEYMLAGSSAISNMTQCDEMKETADNRRYELVKCGQGVTPPSKYNKLIKNGWTAWGFVRTYMGRTLWIFTQDDTWEDDEDSDNHVEFMPTGKVIFGSLNARLDNYFGPSETFKDDSAKLRWYKEMFGFNINALPSVGNIANNSVIDPRMFMLDAYGNAGNTKITVRCQTAPIFATIETDTFVVITNAA